MRKTILFLTLLMVFGASNALIYQAFDVKNRAYPGEALEYLINFTNNDEVSQQVYLNKFVIENTFGKAINIEPTINLHLMPGESQLVNMTVPVSDSVSSGVYRTPLIISYGNNTRRLFIDSIILSSQVKPLEFQNITLIVPDNVVPVKVFNLTITLLCNVEEVTPSFRVLVSDDESIIYDNSFLRTLTNGINIFDARVDLPDQTMPGNYELLVEAYVSDELVTQGSDELTIDSYELIDYDTIISEGLLGKTVRLEASNIGTETSFVNVNYTASVIEPLLATNLKLLVKSDGEVISSKSLLFNEFLINESVSLKPNQSIVLLVDFSYAGLIIIPFIIILGVIAWFFFTRRVVINKEIIACKKEGDEIVVKVGITVRNVSMKSVSDVRIIEDLPIYAKKAGGFGSIKGDVDRDKGVITFDAGRLDSKEEVMISYKFKTDMELLGRIRLPPAIVKFKVKGRVKETSSNTPVIHLIKGGQ